MDPFFALFYAMGMNTMFFDNWSQDFDIVGSLPLEVGIMILRKLDGKSLLSAIRVCRKWLRIVKSDRVLRQTVREELARQRQEKIQRQMFMSSSIKARISALPYPEVKKPVRKFEKSVKTIDKQSKRRTWVSSVSTGTIRKMR